MSHPIEEPPPRTTVRKIADPDYGPIWRVKHRCGCPDNRFRSWHIAMIFATAHRCPTPWPGKRCHGYLGPGVRCIWCNTYGGGAA